jgi:hypothetical protein
MMNRLINFGKYKDYTYNYVIKNVPSYCNYVIKEKSNFKPFIEFQNYLKAFLATLVLLRYFPITLKQDLVFLYRSC